MLPAVVVAAAYKAALLEHQDCLVQEYKQQRENTADPHLLQELAAGVVAVASSGGLNEGPRTLIRQASLHDDSGGKDGHLRQGGDSGTSSRRSLLLLSY